MGMNLQAKTYSCSPEYLIAGTAEITTAVKEAGEALKRGAPVILDSAGKLKAVTGDGETVNTVGLYGIMADDAASGEDGVVYLSGEFFGDKLAFGENVTAAALETAFRNIGIYLR